MLFACVTSAAVVAAAVPAMAQQRVLGIDVSAWQGNISQTTWNNFRHIENRQFVFIRSSRGGTTGFYNQHNEDNDDPPGENTLSRRYDDPYFVQNITRATNAGMFAGAYHFSRPDVTETTPYSGGIANTGTDEADHFIQMAGPWMRPGYLLPVHDLEAGDGARSDNAMAQFAIDFSDRIYEVMGIRPAIYLSGNYANYVLGGASPALRNQVVAAYPTLWSARYANQGNPDAIPVQTGHPKDSFTPIYGPWDDSRVTHPWAFWQYASTGRLQSFKNGTSNLDFNVAQGGIEFVKDFLVPALWTNDNSGEWTTLSNWNSGQTPVAPVQGPGQVPRVGSLTLPAVRLPDSNDTVVLDRPGANITVTLDSGRHDIRKLYVHESLNIAGGSLTVNYIPSPDSTPIAAQFSAPVTLSGGGLRVHTLQVDADQTFTLAGGSLTFDTVNLMPHSTSPAKIAMSGNMTLVPRNGATATIANGAGAGNSGMIDLGGAERAVNVVNSLSDVDLSVDVPIVNGSLVKTGTGTMRLNANSTFSGGTRMLTGQLLVSNSTGSATGSGDVAVEGGTLGGNGSIGGNVVVHAGGQISPGENTGLLTVGGDVLFESGSSLEIEIGGLSAGTQFDQLSVGNAASLDGTLNVSLTGEFTPAVGHSFSILTAADISGTFADLAAPTLQDAAWQMSYTDDAVLLSVVEPAVAGDYNGDLLVDSHDYQMWRNAFGTAVEVFTGADGNGNGIVDAADYIFWRDRMASGGNGSAQPTLSAVPEPAAVALLLLAVAGFSILRPRVRWTC